METRKVRTPSARMLAAKQDEVFDKVIGGTPIGPKPTSMVTLAAQLAKVGESSSTPSTTNQQLSQIVQQLTGDGNTTTTTTSVERDPHHHPHHHMIKETTPQMDEEIDVSNTVEMDDDGLVVEEEHDHEMDQEMVEMQMKPEKMDAQMVLNGDFSVANEVTISSMKYQGRPPASRKIVAYQNEDTHQTPKIQRSANFTGETLNLKSSDLSIPNKAAHFLYFRCYEEGEVQKEFPLTIDENRKGPQNFLVEPRVGLKNTDYYIDSYLWNRGKSTSSKKKIFVEIEGNHVKTSRRSCETAHYVLNWYYSNMENRICKKVCWLETVADCVRASPVLVQYHVNYLSDNPIELRKTPKLYSDTRSVAQELLRSDSPLQTVQRFVETGETDPREIINKKQAYEMRRYVMANARKRNNHRKYEDQGGGMYYDDDMFEDVYFNDHGEPINIRNRDHHSSDATRAAQSAYRTMGRSIENRIVSILQTRLGPPKNHAEMLTEWIQNLDGITSDDYDIVIHNVVNSMRKHLDEMLSVGDVTDYLDDPTQPSTSDNGGNGGASGSGGRAKRMKMMDEVDEQIVEEEDVVDDDDGRHHEHVVTQKTRFEGERYIFEGQEYVEEEVIAEELTEEVPSTSADDVVGGPASEVKFERTEVVEGAQFFFRPSSAADVSVDQ